MSSPSVTKALLWTLLSVWSSFAAAFVVVVKNESDSGVIPCIQQTGSTLLQVLDPAGAVPSKGERVYDNARPWLRSSLMDVKERDRRTVRLLFIKQRKVVDCGTVSLSKGTVLTATPSLDCTSSPMEQVTEKTRYERTADADPGAGKRWSAWVIAPIDDSGGCGLCDEVAATKRYYADGPRELCNTVDEVHHKSTLNIQVCNTHSGQLEDLPLFAWRANGCGPHLMNNSVGCGIAKVHDKLRIEYSAPTIDPAA